ncbi:MAG: hypothetical protein H0V17_24500 [Deltaproteobacteria bacterium]|nr:hypothetical protein [Deltaproteobacteria bacterium]
MATGTIEIKTGFFPLAFLLFFCTPTIEIDGAPQRRSWGKSRFEVAPGTHRVKIYFKYLFKPQCGANEIDVTVAEGQVANVNYWMPPWMFSRGSLKVESQLPAATALR